MGIQPDGEDLRKAIKWISEERQNEPDMEMRRLIETASIQFDLSPLDADYLSRYFTQAGD